MAINMDLYSKVKNSFQNYKDVFNLTNSAFTEVSIVEGEKPEDLNMALSRLPNTDVCFPAELISRTYKNYGINLVAENTPFSIPLLFNPTDKTALEIAKRKLNEDKEKLLARYEPEQFKNTYVKNQIKIESDYANMIFSTPFLGIAGFKLSGKTDLIKALTGLTVTLDPVIKLSEVNETTKIIRFFIHNSYCPETLKHDSINFFNDNFELRELWRKDFEPVNLLASSKLINYNPETGIEGAAVSVVFCDAEILNYCSLIEYPGLNYDVSNIENKKIFDQIYEKASFAESVFFLSSASSHCFDSAETEIKKKLVSDGFGGVKTIYPVVSRAHITMQENENTKGCYKLSFNEHSLNVDLQNMLQNLILANLNKGYSNGILLLSTYRSRLNNKSWFHLIDYNKNITPEVKSKIKGNIKAVPKALEVWKEELFNKEEDFITSIITEDFIAENIPKKENSKILKVNAETLTELALAFTSTYERASRDLWDDFEHYKASDLRNNLFTVGTSDIPADLIISSNKLLTFGLQLYTDRFYECFYDTLHLLNSADRPNAAGIRKVLLEGKKGKPGVIDRLKDVWNLSYFYYSYYVINNMKKYDGMLEQFSEITSEEMECYENIISIVDEVDAVSRDLIQTEKNIQ